MVKKKVRSNKKIVVASIILFFFILLFVFIELLGYRLMFVKKDSSFLIQKINTIKLIFYWKVPSVILEM
jgi:hypothetical protein